MKASRIKNKKAIMALAFLFGLSFGFSMTWSYSMDSSNMANQFHLNTWQTLFTEVFDSPSDWITCQNIEKTITATNKTGEPIAVRMKLEESWISKDGRELPLVSATSGNRMAEIQFAQNAHWSALDEAGYTYYDYNLTDNGTTTSPITGVTLNCLANLSVDTDYADATYHLKITAQAIDAGEQEDGWHTEYAKLKTGTEINLAAKTLLTGAPVTNVATVVEGVSSDASYYKGDVPAQCENDLDDGILITTNDSPYDITMFMCDGALALYTDDEEYYGVKLNSDMSYLYSYFGNSYPVENFLSSLISAEQTDYEAVDNLSHFYEGSITGTRSVIAFRNIVQKSSKRLDASYAFSGIRGGMVNEMVGMLGQSNTMAHIANASHMLSDISNSTAAGSLCTEMNNAKFTLVNSIDLSYIFANSLSSCSATGLGAQLGQSTNMNKATDISHMFEGYTNLSDVTAINSWNIPATTNMTDMFAGTSVANFPSWYQQ